MIQLGSATAVEKQLDQLETLFNAFIIAVLVVVLASAAASKDFELFGARIETNDAYGFVVLVFDCIFLLFFHVVWKIGDLIRNSEPVEASKAIVSVFTHKWLLNPFSYCGPGAVSVANCAVGTFLLVLSWWVGLASLQLLAGMTARTLNRDITSKIVLLFYPICGVAGLLASGRLFGILFSGGFQGVQHSGEREVRKSLLAALWLKCAAASAAGIAGWWIYYTVAHIGI